MKPEIKRLLVEALRSGYYTQITIHLSVSKPEGVCFCALGVLCELHRLRPHHCNDEEWAGYDTTIAEIYSTEIRSYIGKSWAPPSQVLEWSGLTNGEALKISQANDRGATFEAIAEMVELLD